MKHTNKYCAMFTLDNYKTMACVRFTTKQYGIKKTVIRQEEAHQWPSLFLTSSWLRLNSVSRLSPLQCCLRYSVSIFVPLRIWLLPCLASPL